MAALSASHITRKCGPRPVRSIRAASTWWPSDANRPPARCTAATTWGSIHLSLVTTSPMRMPRGSIVADSRKDGVCAGAVNGSPGSVPAMTSSISAASLTVRAIGPWVISPPRGLTLGAFETRPRDGLMPTTPQQLDGIRIDPPPSEPSAMGVRQAATASAAATTMGSSMVTNERTFSSTARMRVKQAAAISCGETSRATISRRTSSADSRLSSESEGMAARHHVGHLLRGDVLAPHGIDHPTALHDHDAVADAMHVPDIVVDDDDAEP